MLPFLLLASALVLPTDAPLAEATLPPPGPPVHEADTRFDLDPAFEDAAGYRLLGRLHSEAPKIVFITGWVSHEKGVQLLRRAVEIGPNHPINQYFLAEAILDHEQGKADEAHRLLERCAESTPRPDTMLEDARYSRMARKKLDELKAAN